MKEASIAGNKAVTGNKYGGIRFVIEYCVHTAKYGSNPLLGVILNPTCNPAFLTVKEARFFLILSLVEEEMIPTECPRFAAPPAIALNGYPPLIEPEQYVGYPIPQLVPIRGQDALRS
mmetsp:Transcript_21785/g.21942  ORF Transcript_21785/g.21942 Transcript_21785/m.21942 type:complete len:118 (-) Transcript_21785:464-817(-)|eukprot:CAMPEP_0182421024 /NCGR_PEP_ID=MMETSP1167-20130531/6188_1 /TAXON_ID=2988 /ORGANISM="Mallomonas Sp, Strain CCMP3275" /LENGTH=117 /DNA_ID=CAMNT_0024597709 /DNA_START=1037 /DNA_END=1390 /DNA_ORIENTATION=-